MTIDRDLAAIITPLLACIAVVEALAVLLLSNLPALLRRMEKRPRRVR